MPVLIIGGEKPEGEEKRKPPMSMKKFMGIGGKYDSEEPEEMEEEAGSDSSADTENVRLFFEAGKAGKFERALEALKALVQSCSESGE